MSAQGAALVAYRTALICRMRLQVADVTGVAGSESGKAQKAAQLRLQGRSLVQARQAVERELA